MTREELSKSVLEHRETVFRIVLGYVKNVHDSEDITQNVFMKLYVHDKDFISKEAEKSWLIRVAINEAKDLLKSAWNRNKSNIEELDESLVAPSHENHFEIYEYVKNLKPKYRTVIYMHYYEGYSTKEIARVLKITQSTVTTHLNRARKQLKEKIEAEEESNYDKLPKFI